MPHSSFVLREYEYIYLHHRNDSCSLGGNQWEEFDCAFDRYANGLDRESRIRSGLRTDCVLHEGFHSVHVVSNHGTR